MKIIKYTTSLFFSVLFFFPLKTFWENYLNVNGIFYDLFWIVIAIIFFLAYNILFDLIIRKK